jgi:hypothetical protein
MRIAQELEKRQDDFLELVAQVKATGLLSPTDKDIYEEIDFDTPQYQEMLAYVLVTDPLVLLEIAKQITADPEFNEYASSDVVSTEAEDPDSHLEAFRQRVNFLETLLTERYDLPFHVVDLFVVVLRLHENPPEPETI